MVLQVKQVLQEQALHQEQMVLQVIALQVVLQVLQVIVNHREQMVQVETVHLQEQMVLQVIVPQVVLQVQVETQVQVVMQVNQV